MGAIRLLNLRRLGRQPLRSGLAVVAVAAGVSLTVAVLVAAGSLTSGLSRFNRRLAGPAPLRVIGAPVRGGLAQGMVGQVAAVPGVAAAVPVVQAVTIARGPGLTQYVVALGVDCRVEALVGRFGCDSAALAAQPDTSPPILSASLLRRMGDRGVLRTDVGPVPLAGALTSPRLDTVNRGRVAIFPLPVAQRLFARADRVDAVYIRPAPGASIQALQRRLAAVVGPSNYVLRSDQLPPGFIFGGGPFIALLGMISLVALGIGALLVYNITTLSLEERRRDFAIVGSLGATSRILVGGPIGEAAALGAVGGLLGTAAGAALAGPMVLSVSKQIEKQVGVGISVHTSALSVLLGLALGVVVAALAAWAPARRASRRDITAELHGQANRDDAAPRATVRRAVVTGTIGFAAVGVCYLAQRGGGIEPWQSPAGSAATLVAVLMLFATAGMLVPVVLRAVSRVTRHATGPVHLAVTNLVREPRRTAVVGVAIASAVGLSFGLSSTVPAIQGILTNTFGREVAGRVWVSNLPVNNSTTIDAKISPATEASLAAFPGVARIEHIYHVPLSTRLGPSEVVASDYQPFAFHVVRGHLDQQALDRGEVVVGTGLARAGHLRPGSFLELPSPAGMTHLRVAAIWANPENNGNAVAMSPAVLAANWGPQSATWIYLRPAAGVSAADLAARVNAAHLDPDLEAKTTGQFVDALAKDVRGQVAPFWALQRALLFVALVATVSTLLLVGVQRRREMGMLAAVGLGPDGLASMTLLEAAALGVVGVAMGALFTLPLFEALRDVTALAFGIRAPFRLAVAAPAVYALLTLAMVVAGASLPAWRASRLEVVEALQYE